MEKVYHNKKAKGKSIMSILWKNQEKILTILIWICCGFSFLWLLKVMLLGYYPDFKTQYYVPKIAFSGENPYITSKILYTPQVYPPTAFFFFLPFSLFTLEFSSYLYTAFSIGALLLSLYLLSKIHKLHFFGRVNLFLLTLVFLSFPVKFTLGMGQVNLYILLLMVIGLWYLQKKKEVIGGVFFGFCLVLKMFPLILPLYFFLKLKGRILFGIFLSLSIGTLLVIVFIPHSLIESFFSILPSFISSWKLDYYNQAISGVIGRSWGVNPMTVFLKTILSLLSVVVTFYVILKKKGDGFENVSLIVCSLITLNLLINTFSWQHHFVWLIIPLYAAFSYMRTRHYKFKYFIALFVAYFLVSINFKNPDILPVLLQSHVFYGGAILLALQIKLLFDSK